MHALRRVGIYFGLVGGERDGAQAEASADWRLHRVRSMLVAKGRATAVLSAVSGLLVLAVFEWQLSDVLIGGAIGAAAWGAVYFFTEDREFVPHGTLVSAPIQPRLEESPDASRLRFLSPLLWALPLCLGLAWLADRWDLGAFFVPGQPLGMTAASLVAAAQVARWERAHDQETLFRADGETVELYATTARVTVSGAS